MLMRFPDNWSLDLPSLTKKGWMWMTWSSVYKQVMPICTIWALILRCLEIPRVSLGGQLSAARHLPLLSSVQADRAIWVASCQVNEYFTKLMVNAKTKHLNIFILAVLQNRASSHQMWSWHEEHQVDWRLLQKAYFRYIFYPMNLPLAVRSQTCWDGVGNINW